MTWTELCDELLGAEAKATAGPWEDYDNFISCEALATKGERGEILAEFFAGNPMPGDNCNDTAFVALARNVARPLAERVKALEAALQEHIDGCFVLRCRDCDDFRTVLNSPAPEVKP